MLRKRLQMCHEGRRGMKDIGGRQLFLRKE
jgi:hypothetical protein